MFTEVGVPHHVPHFHAYYQNAVGIFSIDPVDLIAGALPGGSSGWSRPGRNFTRMSLRSIGTGCKPGRDLCQLSHSGESMDHLICRVVSFQIVAPYTLRILFNNAKEQTIDFRPILFGEIYGPLRDLCLFERIAIDPEAHTLVWPNGADFDPPTLHEWRLHENALRDMASDWEPAQTPR